jgi:hypothetical protein
MTSAKSIVSMVQEIVGNWRKEHAVRLRIWGSGVRISSGAPIVSSTNVLATVLIRKLERCLERRFLETMSSAYWCGKSAMRIRWAAVRNLAKVGVEGSNPFARSNFS